MKKDYYDFIDTDFGIIKKFQDEYLKVIKGTIFVPSVVKMHPLDVELYILELKRVTDFEVNCGEQLYFFGLKVLKCYNQPLGNMSIA